MRDLVHNIAVVTAIAPAVLAADNAPAALDLLGFDSAALSIHIGAGGINFTGSNKVEFRLTHSDDDATYDAVTIEDVQGISVVGTGGIVFTLSAAHPDATIHKVGYVGYRRYLKLLADFSGTHGTGTPIAATLIKGIPRSAPVA